MNNKIKVIIFAVFLTVGFNVSGAVNLDDSGDSIVVVKNHTHGDDDKNNGQIPGKGHAPGCPCDHCKGDGSDVEYVGSDVSTNEGPATIPMKATGTPIIPLVIAFVAILIGIIVARRRK